MALIVAKFLDNSCVYQDVPIELKEVNDSNAKTLKYDHN